MNNTIEIKNIEILEFCVLNLTTGIKKYSKETHRTSFSGEYFRDSRTFFALYPTSNGPRIYYKRKQYPITPELTISIQKNGVLRIFQIQEYGIRINYRQSKYLGLDVWSTEMDVDIFYFLEQSYKTPEFYERYTIEENG
jgi:hypothetical protein